MLKYKQIKSTIEQQRVEETRIGQAKYFLSRTAFPLAFTCFVEQLSFFFWKMTD